MTGLTVRKDNWLNIFNDDEFKELTFHIKESVKFEFIEKFQRTMQAEQVRYMDRMKVRKNKNQVVSIVNLEENLP